MAAVLGGAQSLHTNSMDEALALPAEETARLALRTQQIIAEESNLTETVDPCAGSYAIESLTNKIESEAMDIISRIDEMGGMLDAIEKGWVQRQIQESAYLTQRAVDEGRSVVVGVNRYLSEEDIPIPTLQIRPEVEQEQRRRLEALRNKRDSSAVSVRLEAVRDAAGGDGNLLPPILEAVRFYATVGEISDVLRSVFGIYREKVEI